MWIKHRIYEIIRGVRRGEDGTTKPNDWPHKNKAANNVLNIVEPHLDNGHAVNINYISSLDLACFQKTNGTNYVGNVCVNRKNVPVLSK
jgi:hypothetical protein